MTRAYEEVISVFEHGALYTHKGDQRLSLYQLSALQRFHGEHGVPYFSLIHNGVRFCEYVGVLSLGNTIFEILPKADKCPDTAIWRRVLLGMVGVVGLFDIHAPSSADLQCKRNSILDLYFELFVAEVEQLFRQGLVKAYHQLDGNVTALKGKLLFDKHILQNLTHQERFYTRYTLYDWDHLFNRILYKTIQLIFRLNKNDHLKSRIGNLLLAFPELPDILVTESLFQNLLFNRKTEAYKSALSISRLLLLNYHPDLLRGDNDVLALLFDMNMLWEKFVYSSLRKFKPSEVTITPQRSQDFWKSKIGRKAKIIPDIVINKGATDCIVLDTKWKNLDGYNPSAEDLRQLYAYSKFNHNAKTALVYPGEENILSMGTFFDEFKGYESKMECGIFQLQVDKNVILWQKKIAELIFTLLTSSPATPTSSHAPYQNTLSTPP